MNMNMMLQLYFTFLLLTELFIVCFAADREKNAVLLLGNAGAGKSLLANILLKKNRFISKFQLDQVTTVFDEDSIVEKGKELVVMDVPGLLDADPDVEERNIKQLQEAFKQHNKQIVMFVFNVNGGGRKSAPDLSTFALLFEAYKFNQQSVIFIINGVSNEVYSNKEKERQYRSQWLNVFSGSPFNSSWSIAAPTTIVFVPMFDNFKDGEFSHNNAQAVPVRQNLTEAIQASFYRPHVQLYALNFSSNAVKIGTLNATKNIHDAEKEDEENKFYHDIVSRVFYPAIEYGKSWGESFQTDEFSTWSVKDKTDALINRMCAQNALTGLATGLFNQAFTVASFGLAAPVAIGAAMIASVTAQVSLQVALASAVATIYGKDPHNPITQIQILHVMLGGGLVEVFKQQYGAAGAKLFQQTLRTTVFTGANVKWLNTVIYQLMPSLGRQLFVIEGTKRGFIRVVDFFPLIGPAIGGVLDGGFCLANARGMNFTLFKGDGEEL